MQRMRLSVILIVLAAAGPGGAMAAGADEHLQVDLEGGWTIQSSAIATAPGERLSLPGASTTG